MLNALFASFNEAQTPVEKKALGVALVAAIEAECPSNDEIIAYGKQMGQSEWTFDGFGKKVKIEDQIKVELDSSADSGLMSEISVADMKAMLTDKISQAMLVKAKRKDLLTKYKSESVVKVVKVSTIKS